MNSRPVILVFLMLLMLVTGCVTSASPTPVWSPAKTTHTIGSTSHLSLLWEKSIYTTIDIFGNPCATIDGSLFVIGSEQPQDNLHILAIDQEGKTKWSKEGDFYFTHSSTQLFVGTGQTITALSPETGDAIWSTFLPLANHITDLFYLDEQVFVNATGYPYFVIASDNGKMIAKYSSVDGFRSDYPHIPFYPSMNFQPIALGEDVIFQLGDILYTFQRLSTATNDLVWEIERDSISNSTLIGDLLFYITKDDKLKTISANTGEALYETAIEPSIEFFNLERDVQHAGYYLCSDTENRVLYVILGDSRQLFAFSVAEEE